MVAEYKQKLYLANLNGRVVTLLELDKDLSDEVFFSKDSYRKIVSLNDKSLTSLYEVHFLVKFEGDILKIDEKETLNLNHNLHEFEAFLKSVNLENDLKKVDLRFCHEFFMEKIFHKKDGDFVDRISSKETINLERLKRVFLRKKRIFI